MPSPQQALEALTQDSDLSRLETLLQRFNLFEAVGVLRQELRHSDLLATFLDPRQSHGLGTLFLTELLRVVAPKLDTPNLRHAWAEREWHNVDILIVDDTRRFAIIIENKIDTAEHSDQLSRYYADVRNHFPEHAILALYLTPDGDAPSDRRYRAVSYSQVCQILEKIVAERQEILDPDVAVVLKHYAQMLRRHIVSDSDVAVLCREIYRKHRQAIDTILDHVSSQQVEISEYIQSLIQQDDTLSLVEVLKNWIIFVPKNWSNASSPIPGPPSIYFEFQFQSRNLVIFCTLSPDGDANRRIELFDMARRNHFTACPARLNRSHSRLSTFQVLRVEDYENTPEQIEALLVNKWAVFMRDELPRMVQAINGEKWLWELPA